MTAEAKKLLIKTVAAVVFFAVLLSVVILPKLSKVRRLAADVRVTLQQNQKLQTLILTSKNAGDRLDEIQEALKAYKKKALYQEDLTRVLDEIGAAAQKQMLDVESLRALDEPRRIPGEPFVEGVYEIQQVRVALKAEGTYPEVVRYLKALEIFPYLVSVQSISVKNMTSGMIHDGEDPNLLVEMTIAVLMRVPPIQKKVNLRGGVT